MDKDNYLLDQNFIALTRSYKDGTKEGLINFHKNFNEKSLEKTKKKLQVDTVYIYINDIFDEGLTNNYNLKENIQEVESLPKFDFTKDPINVSMESDLQWSNIRNKVFLPSSNQGDWDFFEMDWILKKWSTSLAFFDYDSFLIIPTYPKDLVNNLVHPNIIIYYIKRYLKKNSMKDLQMKYYVLYLFYRNSFGRKMLEFFYEETLEETKDLQVLIKKIHHLYHLAKENDPFRPFIYYESNCIQSRIKMKFDIKKYILLFISFHSTYLCNHFANNRKQFIYNGIYSSVKLSVLQQFFPTPESIVEEVNQIHSHHNDIITWMSRDHFKTINTPFSKFIYNNWDYFKRRNINLWDMKVFGFIDSQLTCGAPLQDLFPFEWTNNFHLKGYTFEKIPPRIRPKRKLK